MAERENEMGSVSEESGNMEQADGLILANTVQHHLGEHGNTQVTMQEQQQATNEASEQAQNELLRREEELTKRELRMEATQLLQEKQLPLSLLEALPLQNSEQMKGAIESVETAFFSAVSKEVAKKLSGNLPKSAAAAGFRMNMATIASLSREQIMANMEEIDKVLALQ